jgi:hypothetical protein
MTRRDSSRPLWQPKTRAIPLARLLNVDGDRIHLIVSPTELDIVVDALRSVGNVELAERFESVLQQFGQGSGGERQS